jgi:hypothetical protein
MNELIHKIQERISVSLIHMTISNPKTKGGIKKIIIRPIELKNEIYYQKAAYEEKKVFHERDTDQRRDDEEGGGLQRAVPYLQGKAGAGETA